MRDDDPLDMGFVELTREMVGQMPAARFVSLSEIDVEPRLRMGCYLVYGYPNSFSGVNTKDRVVYTEPLRYLTELHDNPEDRFDPRWQVRLKYPPLGYTHSKGHVSMPSPKGMSRCGIWRIVDLKPAAMWRRDDVKLVAIDQMWHGQRRYIQGTRLPYLLFMIYRQYPSLRPAMDLRLGLVTRGW